MGGDDPGSNSGEPSKRRFLDRVSLQNLQRAGLVAVLAATAAFGGLDTAEPMTAVAMGSTYFNGAYKITPHRVAELCDPSSLPIKGNMILEREAKNMRLFALFATVENTSDSGGIVLHNIKPDPEDTFTLDRTGVVADLGAYGPYGMLVGLPSGKTEDVTVVWGLPFGEYQKNDTVTIRISDFERYKDLMSTVETWRTARSYGQISTRIEGCVR
ncbi:hypothetical protein ACFWE3_02575 [Mycobacteriaceae bacterium NPDC060252]